MGAARDLGDDADEPWRARDLCLRERLAREDGARDALVAERPPERQCSARVQDGHLGARPRSAGRAVDLSVTEDDAVLEVGTGAAAAAVELDEIHRIDVERRVMDGNAFIDSRADGHAEARYFVNIFCL